MLKTMFISAQGIPESRRDQVIYNARTNWELLRTSPLSPANATQGDKLAECANLSASLKDLRVIPEEKDGLIPGSCIGVDAPLSARAIQIR